MKLLAFILMTPFVWWIGAIFGFSVLAEEDKRIKAGYSAIAGLFITLAFWGLAILLGWI